MYSRAKNYVNQAQQEYKINYSNFELISKSLNDLKFCTFEVNICVHAKSKII